MVSDNNFLPVSIFHGALSIYKWFNGNRPLRQSTWLKNITLFRPEALAIIWILLCYEDVVM